MNSIPAAIKMYSASELIRFLIVGCIVFALDTSIFMTFYSSGFSVMISNGIAMLSGFMAGLVMHHSFTFQGTSVLGFNVLMRYSISLIVNYMISTIALNSLLFIGSSALLAKLLSTIVAAGTNYLLSRHFVFKSSATL